MYVFYLITVWTCLLLRFKATESFPWSSNHGQWQEKRRDNVFYTLFFPRTLCTILLWIKGEKKNLNYCLDFSSYFSPVQTLSGGTVVPSTDKLSLVQASVWSSWYTSARLLVWVWAWVRVKPACTSFSLHAFPFLSRALDSTPSPGPNPLISMPGEHGGGGSLDCWKTGAWGDDWLQPLCQIISATCTAAVRPQLIVDHGVEVKEGHIFPPPICSPSILLPWPPFAQNWEHERNNE